MRPRPVVLKPIIAKWTTVERGQLREDLFRRALAELTQRYGGESRRTLRSMARVLAHRQWKERAR